MILKVLSLSLIITLADCQKVPVKVYYESLCPDSAAFINRQLSPAAKDLLQYIDLKLIPFGKSTYRTEGSDVKFECHHGPNECYGNKVHACAIENIQSNSYRQDYTRESLILAYVDCLMAKGRDPAYPIERCAEEVDYKNWEILRDCANSTEGSKLLQKFGEETNIFQNPLSSVPTIVFKDQYDSNLQKRSLDNFRDALCGVLHKDNIHAKECIPTNSASSLTITSVVTLLSVFLVSLIK